jgi:hypothetical protein
LNPCENQRKRKINITLLCLFIASLHSTLIQVDRLLTSGRSYNDALIFFAVNDFGAITYTHLPTHLSVFACPVPSCPVLVARDIQSAPLKILTTITPPQGSFTAIPSTPRASTPRLEFSKQLGFHRLFIATHFSLVPTVRPLSLATGVRCPSTTEPTTTIATPCQPLRASPSHGSRVSALCLVMSTSLRSRRSLLKMTST